MNDFTNLLGRLAAEFPSRKAFAKAIGMNASRLSRAMNLGDFPLNVLNCLRLAKISGEPASNVLRAAGKSEVADLIESLYGEGQDSLLSDDERALIDGWRSLSLRQRDTMRSLMTQLAEAALRDAGKAQGAEKKIIAGKEFSRAPARKRRAAG